MPSAYREIKNIGHGAFGEVSLVMEKHLGDFYALKRLKSEINTEATKNFAREVSILKGLRHVSLLSNAKDIC